ncbi:type II toxin-antitoxin system HicB family antitoxin [uncultured Rhodospira sp.]|mgnify:CR=1 FL=1|uniref:type II toxin-antitoxin system HicB family antitoxin n=1 Tax=uncultured Rhodospira sp. TaxID=1936189 RepID=UPI002621FD45|nr:type II toxin-antitoxin system HicB family antitoxin [uncultured Rhodospira sp.]
MNLRVLIRPDPEDGGFVVSCPALPGCHSQGETVDEALANIREAIELCLEVLNDRATASDPHDQVMDIAV